MRRGDRKVLTVRYISRTVLLLHSGCSLCLVFTGANTTDAEADTTFEDPYLSLLLNAGWQNAWPRLGAYPPPPWGYFGPKILTFSGLPRGGVRRI